MNTLLAVIAAAALVNPVWYPPKPDLVSKELVKGELVLTFRSTLDDAVVLTSIPPQYKPATVVVWREVYGASNGVVVLKRRLDGKVTPESTTKTPEKVEWTE